MFLCIIDVLIPYRAWAKPVIYVEKNERDIDNVLDHGKIFSVTHKCKILLHSILCHKIAAFQLVKHIEKRELRCFIS